MTNNYCPFREHRNFFGSPNTGVHRRRLLDVAVVDYVLTLLAAFITSWLTSFPLVLSTLVWFTLGLVLHALFGVDTSAVRWLGWECKRGKGE